MNYSPAFDGEEKDVLVRFPPPISPESAVGVNDDEHAIATGAGAPFQSILFAKPEDSVTEGTVEAPAYFVDLGLDQIIDTITAGSQEYNLKPFFYTPLNDIDAVNYRHEIMQDLDTPLLLAHITLFAQNMCAMREHLHRADKLYYKYEKQRWFLDAVDIYCDTVTSLLRDLSLTEMKSRGFLAFHQYLAHYAASDRFTSLLAGTKQLKAALSDITYCILIDGDRISVRKYNSERDYSADVAATFEKFQQGAVKDYRLTFPTSLAMNSVEANVMHCVAQLYPDIFGALDTYCAEHGNYLDKAIAVFDREVQFYVAYLAYVAVFRRAGLTFCYPHLSTECKEVSAYDGFDLALAYKLIRSDSSVVCNDFYLHGSERIFVVSGPNQGGKTTFARTFGQLHYLASIGCPVPGRKARLLLFDTLFTHFEREENIQNLRGKLQDDLVRIHDILERASSQSIIIMNEIFTSTTLQDAVFLSTHVMERLITLDLLCVWVTFIDELASFGEQTVSMVSTIVPNNPKLRTFKVIRMPADGLSYAASIAEKHGLTYESLTQRIHT